LLAGTALHAKPVAAAENTANSLPLSTIYLRNLA
jgi:hypothetical protein